MSKSQRNNSTLTGDAQPLSVTVEQIRTSVHAVFLEFDEAGRDSFEAEIVKLILAAVQSVAPPPLPVTVEQEREVLIEAIADAIADDRPSTEMCLAIDALILAVQQSAHQEMAKLKLDLEIKQSVIDEVRGEYRQLAKAINSAWPERSPATLWELTQRVERMRRADADAHPETQTPVQSVVHDGRQEEQEKEIQRERTSATEGDGASGLVPAPELPHDEASPIDELCDLLQSVGAKVRIGLRQQGKFDRVHEMYLGGESWDAIGKAIGWDGPTAERWYRAESKTAVPSHPPTGDQA